MSLPSRDAHVKSLRYEHGAWVNPRTRSGLSDKEIDDLAEDFKVRGVQVPLIVQKVLVNGEIVDVVLEGQRRGKAAEKAGLKTVPVVDRTEEPIELTSKEADAILMDMLSVGARREGLASPELVAVAKRLRDHDHTMFDIGQAIGKSETWVSKMLKAFDKATPEVIGKWEAGKLTDEQFKDLATLKAADQRDGMKKALDARDSGDHAGARAAVKEMKERTTKKAESAKHEKRVVKGPQLDLIAEPKKIVKPSPAVLDDIIHQADKRPPTSDYVKGQVAMARYVLGQISADDFAKPWHAWLSRVSGAAKVKAPRRERKRGGKARKGGGKKAKKARR